MNFDNWSSSFFFERWCKLEDANPKWHWRISRQENTRSRLICRYHNAFSIKMWFQVNRFHVLAFITWQFANYFAGQNIFAIYSNNVPKWKCENSEPTKDCNVYLSCPKDQLTFVDPIFSSAAMEWVISLSVDQVIKFQGSTGCAEVPLTTNLCSLKRNTREFLSERFFSDRSLINSGGNLSESWLQPWQSARRSPVEWHRTNKFCLVSGDSNSYFLWNLILFQISSRSFHWWLIGRSVHLDHGSDSAAAESCPSRILQLGLDSDLTHCHLLLHSGMENGFFRQCNIPATSSLPCDLRHSWISYVAP